ncbi:MAG: branched-chain amino acid ABC transporter permease [Rhodobacteraceae bacterium]|nr:branched-chain amino acid ABC transporter permease [Paracoccaceae bacterium]
MDPSGVFSVSYRQDRKLVRTKWQVLFLLGFLALLYLLPQYASPRIVAIGNIMLISAVVAVGLQICTGYAGQINLGQAAFMGVGAYTAGLLASKYQMSFLLTIPLAGLSAAGFGFLFGLTAARIKGFYLALTTIAAQFIFHFAVLNLPSSWMGGSNGVTVPAATLFGLKISSTSGLFYLNLIFATIMIAGAFGIVRSRFGRAFVAVRDDDVAAGIMGINVARTKATAFLIGAFYAGVGGALWAYMIRFVGVDQFTLFNSIFFIAMIIVGGMGSITGALIGVFIIRMIQEVIATVGPNIAEAVPFLGGDIVFASMNMFLGGVIAMFMILEPKGLMHRWNIIKSSYRIWPFPY